MSYILIDNLDFNGLKKVFKWYFEDWLVLSKDGITAFLKQAKIKYT